jgi:acyl-CoA thioesterase-2
MADLSEEERAKLRSRTPEQLVDMLTNLLDVEEIDTDLYRGSRLPGGRGRVFGGQVIAQALQAAQRSVDEGKTAHSLHAYFMRAGDDALPIVYRVERDFEGRSFATRRVIALQRGQPILNMACSFMTVEERRLQHQYAMPDVPKPDTLVSERELRARILDQLPEEQRRPYPAGRPIEVRPCFPELWQQAVKQPAQQHSWFRAASRLGDDPALHRGVLAYASDLALMSTAVFTHGVTWHTHNLRTASLDHAMWFHEPFRADEWLLYATDAPWSGHSRGLNRGLIFTEDGRLVASVTQEGLMRLLD